MEFQRKPVPFLHRGMNWNAPVEKLQDGQVAWAKNVRVLEQGTVSSAHGHTEAFAGINASYVHSISRLNILNQQKKGDGSPAFDPALGRTYVVGGDERLYVFQDQDTLSSAALNPVTTPGGREYAFSGNPLSIIDAQPSGAAVAWKYIADSKQMATVGYYPGDHKGSQMARALTIGLDPPVNISVVNSIGTGAGNLKGDYQWAFAYRRLQTGARSNPSAATRWSVAHPALTLDMQQVTMPLPQTPIDPLTGVPDTNVMVDVYRFGGSIFRWALVGSGVGGSTFTDNISDLQLLAAPAPPQATDASTGLTRFNLYRPFVTQDIARTGQADLSRVGGSNVYIITATDNNRFNLQWLPGSVIYVNAPGGSIVACTLYQVINDTILELADNLSTATDAAGNPLPGATPVIPPGPVTWSTNAGTLMAGQPLPHMWGPYGIGQSGSFIFACGDPNARGTLYWTNGNDPDSTDVVNNIIVTSPSEKLVTGCVYDGQPFCWSTERQFQIYPSLTIFGQFTTAEVAGAKGCWLEWSLSVQSNGLADQSVSWRGKDGVYDWSQGGLQRLTDPLYAFFPHDNNPGLAPETILPFIGANSAHPEKVGNLDDTQPKYHRLCWFQGLLYYDFVANVPDRFNPNVAISNWSTLVWDTVNISGGGWVSLDQPFPHTINPIARGIDIGANDPAFDANPQTGPFGPIFGPMARGGSLKVSWGGAIFDYYGLTRGFESRFITRAEDLGDSRAQKRWGDYWLDCTPLNEFTVYPLAGFHRCTLKSVTVPGSQTAMVPDFCPPPAEPGVRAQFVLDFAEFKNAKGAALMSPTLGLDIHWVGANGQFSATLNQWQPSYVLKPEIISFRATDLDDLGTLGAKYFTGMNLEANTFGQTALLNVLLDSAQIAQIPINHDGQSEHPYAFTPKAGYEAQLQMNAPQDINGQPVTWQLFKINWIFEPWPDAVARDSFFSDLGYTGAKFMQGMVVPMETGGNPVTFQVNSDCGQSVTMGPVSTPNLCKNDIPFSFGPCNNSPSDPFIAHQIQIVPNSPARIWYDKIKWIWEPEPELVATWMTQPTNHDFPTWHHQRDCFIAYRGGSGTPTLYITTEYGTDAYPLDPVTPNQYVRCYRVLRPQKAKWRYYRVEGCGLFRLYIKDCSVRVKEWGSTGPYVSAQPFGDLSRSNGGARI
jgi:hypothetical protein